MTGKEFLHGLAGVVAGTVWNNNQNWAKEASSPNKIMAPFSFAILSMHRAQTKSVESLGMVSPQKEASLEIRGNKVCVLELLVIKMFHHQSGGWSVPKVSEK
jgi:hypothetical protein